jgi:hypothetical protein
VGVRVIVMPVEVKRKVKKVNNKLINLLKKEILLLKILHKILSILLNLIFMIIRKRKKRRKDLLLNLKKAIKIKQLILLWILVKEIKTARINNSIKLYLNNHLKINIINSVKLKILMGIIKKLKKMICIQN